ncbi:head-tail joining protein [Ancylobacter mangrovi]|uniref:head-tail joining protein n=1 Tax=Ancylobacter mangrovi TaxID=2972472 RepID=UPI002162BFA9|nr:hypothetical protein [Ancylobacter mangrovi]MCS0501383.1 hypothetical protein [Ancylobacter mangrovi]
MNIASQAVDAVFAAFGRTGAEHRPGGQGVGTPVRIILRRPDDIVGFGETQLRMPTMIVEVRSGDCPVVADGDTFTLPDPATGLDRVYTVEGAPKRDPDRLVWTCGCRGG